MGIWSTLRAPRTEGRDVFFRALAMVMACVAFAPTSALAAEVSDAPGVFGPHHRGWASKLEKRPDLLFVADHTDSTDAREIAAQIDTESDLLMVTAEEFESDLPSSLKRADVCVLGTRTWDDLPDGARAQLLDACEGGMGLILLGPEITPGTGLDELFSEDAIEFSTEDSQLNWRVASHGEGRVTLGTGSSYSDYHAWVPALRDTSLRARRHYDYQLSSVVREILRASGRMSEISIKSITRYEVEGPDPDEIPPQLPPEFIQYMTDAQMTPLLSTFGIELDAPAPNTLTVSIRVRRDDDAFEWMIADIGEIPKGAAAAGLLIPLGRGGQSIDFWVEEKGRVCDWTTERVEVERWPMLEDVSVSKHIVEANDSIEVTCSVRAQLFAPAPTYAHVFVTDTLERVIAHQSAVIPPEGGTQNLRVAWADALTHALRVDVYLSENSRELLSYAERRVASHTRADLVVRQEAGVGLRWAVDHPVRGEPGVHASLMALRTAGVDAVVSGTSMRTDTAALESDLDAILRYPKLSEISGGAAACPGTPEWRQRQFQATAHWGRWAGALGIRHALLNLEETHPDNCDAEECEAMFRNSLQSFYPNLAALNASWGTSFANWAEISSEGAASSTAGQVDHKRATRDRLELAERELAGLFAGNAGGIVSAALITDAESAGVSGRIARAGLSLGADSNLSSARLRSYRAGEALTGLYPADTDEAAMLPWRALADGHGVIVTDAQCVDDAEFEESLSAARGGLDALLLAASVVAPEIGVYENDATVFSASEGDRGHSSKAHRAVARALSASALPYRFVSYDQLMSRGLDNLRLMLVPRVAALSPEEHAVFKSFARQGGLIITDSTTGTLDEHGNPAANPGLHAGALTDFDDPASLRAALHSAFEELGLQRSSPALDDASDDAEVTWSRFQYGEATIFCGLQQDVENLERPALSLGEEEHGHDLIAAEALRKKKARAEVNAWGASVIAVLPYRVSRIIPEAPEVVAAGQRLPFKLTIKTFDRLPGDHLVQARLIDSEGIPLDHYETTITCQDGQGQGYIPLALNERVGIYTLELRDLLTGITATVKVKVI